MAVGDELGLESTVVSVAGTTKLSTNSEGRRLKVAQPGTTRDLALSISAGDAKVLAGHLDSQWQQELDSRYLAWKERWVLHLTLQLP